MATKLIWLALAGAMGTLCRYLLAGFVQNIGGAEFPWGTLAVNIIGCFIAGCLWTFFENHSTFTGELRIIVFIGFLGAFTTFSAFILETGEFLRSSEWMYAFANVAMQNVFGIIAFGAGAALIRFV